MLPLFPCALIGITLQAGPVSGAEPAAAAKGTAPIAVVELFTSEACPSCPAADAYLGELASDARRNGQQIYPLAFHVDYWSRPGREDPLSSQQFADRQRSYVEAMGLDGAYTPQMIVNGTEEFVGSERGTGAYKIKSALANPARVAVKVAVRTMSRDESQQIAVEYEVSSVPENCVINIALVENNPSRSSVRTSSTRDHVNVVRAFRTVTLKSDEKKQKIELTPPSSSNPGNCSIIAYVQNARTRAVLGAAKTELREAPTGQAMMQVRD